MLVENFRPDVKDKLGIGYETMAAINPRLIYASISGYGEDGPYRLRPGFDQIAQGMGGLMSITGAAGAGADARRHPDRRPVRRHLLRPWRHRMALIEREKSGQGQWVKSSLLQAQLFMLDFQAARWLMKGEVAEAGRQQPSDLDPDRRLPDPRRLHEPGGVGTQDLGAPVQRDRRARAGDPSRLRHRSRALDRTATRCMASSSSTSCRRDTARLGRDAERRRRAHAARSTRSTRPSPIRRCATSASSRRSGDVAYLGQPVTLSRTPEPGGCAPAGSRRAHRRGAARPRLRRCRDRRA